MSENEFEPMEEKDEPVPNEVYLWNDCEVGICGVDASKRDRTSDGGFLYRRVLPPSPDRERKMHQWVTEYAKTHGGYYPSTKEVVAWADANPIQDHRETHPDDEAVDRFAIAMKEKLAQARAKGRHGWQYCLTEDLSTMLREHVEKGDARDVANFCMMIWHKDGKIRSASSSKPTEDEHQYSAEELETLFESPTGLDPKVVAKHLHGDRVTEEMVSVPKTLVAGWINDIERRLKSDEACERPFDENLGDMLAALKRAEGK